MVPITSTTAPPVLPQHRTKAQQSTQHSSAYYHRSVAPSLIMMKPAAPHWCRPKAAGRTALVRAPRLPSPRSPSTASKILKRRYQDTKTTANKIKALKTTAAK